MSSILRSVPRATVRFQPSTFAASTTAPRRLAHQDYGSGEGSPVGENPQAQGKNPREDAEHPGPPKPSAAQQGNKPSEQSQQKEQSPSGGQNKGNDSSTSSSPQPRIHNHSHNAPSSNQEEVERHNQELERRNARTSEQSKDEKVGKGFWSGKGGADREP